MSDEKDLGIIMAVLERLERQRLPHVLSIKEYVLKGEKLKDRDIDFLIENISDLQTLKPLIIRSFNKRPEFQQLEINIIYLYHSIAEKALLNEKNNE